MKILVLGAGAIGGYFGGRLAQAGADIAFLVREKRAAQLRERGLVVRSPHGDFTQAVRPVLGSQLGGETFDLVLLACKAYDLDAAMESIRPALGERSHVLPLLNGVAHIAKLQQAFGAQRVLAGSCGIPATLNAEGEVVQLMPIHRIVFGRPPESSVEADGKLQELLALFQKTPVEAILAADIWLELWEKFTGLATLAASTCLMRASVGDILEAEGGDAYLQQTYDACVRAAEVAGHAPRAAAQEGYRQMLRQRGSPLTASMLRDLEAGNRTEGAHIVADMLHKVQAAGADPAALLPAWIHLQAYELRRARNAA
ncbi:ketopantoate reductase family protein [Ramlibacter sp. G-1-2-2]|uniref:2-dehydropantoate 2-reductase n=1 Tax=Ramlibacter agri TaxID=2728837 RepID=A0A848H005_9BURK|nr:ketopantoate reductase family protein [Ramlibacter agri]NML44145.1 ketopantoate reductase family protein [Ramlibacter agri]